MSEKVDILAIGAHPDDIELGCGGTLMKEIEMGKKVGLMDLTQGELGTRGSKEIRKQEAKLARDFMGAKFRDNLMDSGLVSSTFKRFRVNKGHYKLMYSRVCTDSK